MTKGRYVFAFFVLVCGLSVVLFQPHNWDGVFAFHYIAPRVVAGALAGAAFAFSGQHYQLVFANPLAGPGILGIGAIIQLALIAGLILFPEQVARPFLLAFVSAIGAVWVLQAVAGRDGRDPQRLLLIGMVVALMTGAVIGAVTIYRGEDMMGLFFWGAGSPEQLDWTLVRSVGPFALLAIMIGVLFAPRFQLLALGDEAVRGLGQPLSLLRNGALGVGTLAAAVAVTLVGPITFIGLIVPNILRLMGYSSHRQILWHSLWMGALVLVFTDALSYALMLQNIRVTAGILTVTLCAPLFLVLVARTRRPAMKAREGGVIGSGVARHWVWMSVLLVLLLGCMISMFLGQVTLGGIDILHWIEGAGGTSSFIIELRLPRILTALGAGGLLGVAGYCLQVALRNPVAGPEVMGLTQGSALFAIILSLFVWTGSLAIFAGAFIGGAAVLLLVCGCAHRGGGAEHYALSGIAIAAVCAGVSASIALSAQMQVAEVITWLSGSLYNRSWNSACILLSVLSVLVGLLYIGRGWFALSVLPDEAISAVGGHAARLRFCLFSLSVVAVSVTVSQVGAVGFVGLVAPHIARRLMRASPCQHMLLSCVLGMVLLVCADFAGRVVFAPFQLPAGIVTALVGAPYFLFVMVLGNRLKSRGVRRKSVKIS